ncbi:MAG: hypothetical protein ABI775_03650 [Pseudonocardiales bacterium]|nr:hypothetical protein [Actinomycetota bacterium]
MTTDDELMDRLRRIADDVDAAPELVTESARAALSTRRLDDELAELLHDSDLAPSQGVRDVHPGPRMLSFEAGDVSLEIQLEEVQGQLAVRGIAVGAVGEAEIETTTGESTAASIDATGWFRVEGLPAEPLRIRVHAADGTAVTTGWIRT